MTIGERVRAIREANGDSLRDAQRRTGIGYSILFRIENGEMPRTLESILRRFAAAYNVDVEEILDGNTPRGVFHWRIRKLPAGERMQLIRAPLHVRVKLVLDFLRGVFPQQLDLRRVALAASLPVGEIEMAVKRWHLRHPEFCTTFSLARGLHEVAGISWTWLVTGWFDEETGLTARAISTSNTLGVMARRTQTPVKGSVKGVQAAIETLVQPDTAV